jgi:hypothetical protein
MPAIVAQSASQRTRGSQQNTREFVTKDAAQARAARGV